MSEALYEVLIVCSGNTCRSPLAAGRLVQALGAESDRVRVVSAGTGARDGAPATVPSIEVAARDGVDLTSHRARRLTPEIVAGADLILVMEPAHGAAVKALGARADRVHLMSAWPPPGEPELAVVDPFGGSIEAYEECWRRIRRHIDRIVPQVREALRERSA